jgi:hypothetical protein
MTFFYDLNKKLDSIRAKPELTHAQLNERDMSRAAKGYEKYGKEGMEALAKAGRDGKALDPIRDKYNKYDESIQEANAPVNFDKVLDAIAALYGDDMWHNDSMQDVAHDLEQQNPTDQELDFIIAKGRLPKRLANTQFSAGDGVQFGEGNAFAKAVVDAKRDGIQPGEKIRVGGKEMPLKEIGDTPAGLAKVQDYRAAVGRQYHKTGEYDTRLSDTDRKRNNPFHAKDAVNMPNAANQRYNRQTGAARAKKIELARAQGLPAEFQTKDGYVEETDAPMSPKQKSFAALAEPKDKITFADKIAGAKQEVDEMLGDVAAEAMKSAIGKMGAKSHQAKTTMKHVNASNASPRVKSAIGKASADIEPGAQGYRSRAAALKAAGVKGAPGEVDEDDNNPFTSYKKPRAERPKVGSVERGALHDIEHTATGRKVTRRVDPNTGHSVGADDDTPASGEKRGRGRPGGKGAGKSIGAKGPSGKSKLMTREDEYDDEEIKQAIAMLKKAGYKVEKAEEELEEKAVSKKQQKFMGMVHAAQKGEKPASKEVGKVAKSMGKKDAEDFASTKHKGLPEKKAKKKEVDETTTSGSVSVAPAGGKATSMFGKGVYEGALAKSFNTKLNTVLTEGMSINMSVGEDGTKSLSVNATDEDAVQLAQLLKMAGLGGQDGGEVCPACGNSACGCEQVAEGDLANSPEPGYSDANTMLNTLSGGLNGRKSTGQTTIPVVASQLSRQQSVTENTEERLWNIYNRYNKT